MDDDETETAKIRMNRIIFKAALNDETADGGIFAGGVKAEAAAENFSRMRAFFICVSSESSAEFFSRRISSVEF